MAYGDSASLRFLPPLTSDGGKVQHNNAHGVANLVASGAALVNCLGHILADALHRWTDKARAQE